MISAITSVISYNVSISLALGDAPLAGVKNASSVGRCPKAGRILFRPGRYALDDECHEGRRRRRATAAAVVGGGCLVASATAETRRSPLRERGRALDEVRAARRFLLQAGLQLQLLVHARIQPVV